MTRDIIENALRRVHSNALHNTTVDVYEPDVQWDQGDGWDVTYPGTPSATYDARVDSPSPDSDRDRSGTTSEIDIIVRVRDDTGQQWTGFGEDAEAPVRVEDTADGTLYEVETVVEPHNGTTELEAAEL